MKVLGSVLVLLAMAGFASALSVESPEIDGSSISTGVALISGALLIARSRAKR